MTPNPPRADMPDVTPSLQQEVARLAASPEVRSAYNWFRTQEPQLLQWQMEMARIAAPPFGESARGAWLQERFREIGLDDIRIDDVGNVFGTHPGFGRRYVALSAHIDTVFPANTPLNIRQQGSRRFEVIVRGPGGHSWSDFGAPNPIVILAKAIETFSASTVPTIPKTTFNIGVIRGGTSVNSIPESASMKVDIRSTSMAEMERLEHSLRRALNRAVEDESMAAEMRSSAQKRPSGVNCEVVVIGNRPAGEL